MADNRTHQMLGTRRRRNPPRVCSGKPAQISTAEDHSSISENVSNIIPRGEDTADDSDNSELDPDFNSSDVDSSDENDSSSSSIYHQPLRDVPPQKEPLIILDVPVPPSMTIGDLSTTTGAPIQVNEGASTSMLDAEPFSMSPGHNNTAPHSESVASQEVIESHVRPDEMRRRRRIKHPPSWKKNVKRSEILSGKGKSLKSGCAPCRKNCTYEISEKTRHLIFKTYWSKTKNWDAKRAYLNSLIETIPTKRKTRAKDAEGDSRRQMTVKYFFFDKNRRVQVCKDFFLRTLGIGDTTVRNVIKKRTELGALEEDFRGKHKPANKLDPQIRDSIRAHIESFPSFESHYSREKTQKRYLNPDLNLRRMYRLYKEDCEAKNMRPEEICKEWAYVDTFKTEYSHLSFKKPSTDTCDTCDSLRLQLKESNDEEEKAMLQTEYDKHLEDAQNRYDIKKKDKIESREAGSKTKVIMLDLQKCLPTPYLFNSKSFYSLKLWTLNLTVYDATTKASHCIVWNEAMAGKGGDEIASALLKWAQNTGLANSEVEHLKMWSDNCTGQNRNSAMMAFYFWLLKVCPNLKQIQHQYLLVGHTHQEADHIHGVIERSLRYKQSMEIATPWDWGQFIQSNGCSVIRMDLHDFKEFETLYAGRSSPLVHRKVNEDKENFLISKVVCFVVKRSASFKLYYKTSFSDNTFQTVDLTRNVRSPSTLPNVLPFRESPRGITKKKHDHLLGLLEWIPTEFHNFYKELPTTEHASED